MDLNITFINKFCFLPFKTYFWRSLLKGIKTAAVVKLKVEAESSKNSEVEKLYLKCIL